MENCTTVEHAERWYGDAENLVVTSFGSASVHLSRVLVSATGGKITKKD